MSAQESRKQLINDFPGPIWSVLFHTTDPIIAVKNDPYYVEEISSPLQLPPCILLTYECQCMTHKNPHISQNCEVKHAKIICGNLEKSLVFLFYEYQISKFDPHRE